MNSAYNNIEDLLVKYLLEEANAEEHLLVNKWREAKPENEQYFIEFKLIWEQSKVLASKNTIEENAAWERLKIRLNNAAAENTAPQKTRVSLRNFMRVAAVLVLSIGVWFLYNRQTHKMMLVQSDAAIKTETLPDGSVVILNKNASISYPGHFTGPTRKVKLSGEAFFTITPDKQKPFIIEANNVAIKVVGTSFNVKTEKEMTEVIVETGIVEVSSKAQMIRLSPAEKAIVTKESVPVKEASKDALYNYYRTNEFVCNSTPLWRLVQVLNEAYNTRIIIANPSIRDLPLTTTFKNENLEEILAIISETLDVSAERSGTEIILQ